VVGLREGRRITASDIPPPTHQTFVAVRGNKSERIRLRAHFAVLLALSLVIVPWASAAGGAVRQSSAVESAGFLHIALPPSGEVLVENRRGSVEVEVWSEDYVALAAVVEGGQRAARGQLPVSIEHNERLLTIKVSGAAGKTPSRVSLKLRVPASARLKVFTSDGELSVGGVPASLVAQTLSGDLLLALPVPLDASVSAQSLNGAVTLGDGIDAPGASERVRRGKFQARWGAGSHSVNLFSGRGRVQLTALTGGTHDGANGLVEARPPRVRDAPEESPGATAPARAPQAAETPQEVGEDEVVRVESDLVTLNVSVVDRASGRGLVGLTAGDFRIYEDNAEQQIAHFESAEAPFDLLLLLDLSGSTARVTETIRAAARRFLAATRPQDRIAIMTFAGDTQVVSPLTSDRASLRDAIERIAPPKGDTRLYDALASALDYTNRGADAARRRAVILMSDGLDSTLPNVTGTGSTLPYEEVRSRAQEFDGVLYTIWTSTEYEAFSPEDIQPETFDLAHDRMEELAAAGGGAFYEVERLEDLAGAYERVVADLGTVYSLSYRPTNKRRDGRWRAIRIRLPRRPDAVARGKRGYSAK
jgi:VWFA-related protein